MSEVLQPNVFLFQRDFFTVCFPLLFVSVDGSERSSLPLLNVMEALKKTRVQFVADITSARALIVAVFTRALSGYCT